MWLKMYLGDLYVDKKEVEFNEMDTAKEKQRHLEGLANEMAEENRFEILSTGITPMFFIHHSSEMNYGLKPQTWKEIIKAIGSNKALENIEALSKQFAYEKIADPEE